MRPLRIIVFILLGALCVEAQITGNTDAVNMTTGQRPMRKNIEELQSQGGPEWDLYIQALISMVKVNEDDWLSYYQIAGIHGLPFKPWNGVDQVPGGNIFAGYCPHGQMNFLHWHRPYIALFEQVLLKHAEKMANLYSDDLKPVYQDAAKTLRAPYWDWASSPSLPFAATAPAFMINTSAGLLNLRNPLFSYQFQNFPFTDPEFKTDLAQFNESKRCTIIDSSQGVNSFDDSNWNLTSDGIDLKDEVYSVFTQANNFETMATTASPGPSFETPHNTVHNDIACVYRPDRTGHMGDINWSAFDPVFFLHHANVDRLMAMWQAIYYNNTMFTSTADGHPVFGTAEGNITAESPLKPFRNNATGEFYTSNDVASTRAFGYTYPEIRDWEQSGEDLAKTVREAVNKMYGDGDQATAESSSSRRRRRRQWGRKIRDAASSQLKDYSAEIRVDRAQLALPCSIEVSLGGRKVGAAGLLSMPSKGVAYVSISLRRTLKATAIGVDVTQQGGVVGMLKRRIEVAVRSHDGTVLPAESIVSMSVDILEQDVSLRTSNDEFPSFGDVKRWSVKKGVVSGPLLRG